tara:strand:- start:624 stop:1214 length:591 start_codon:yes stop_codon:yes gene_type:complete
MLPFKKPQTDPFEAYYFKNALSEQELLNLETQFNTLEYEEAKVTDNATDVITDINRRSQVKWVPHTHEWLWLYEKLHDMILEANSSLWNFDLHSILEYAQYTEYNSNQKGHYNWHVDLGPGDVGSLRKISLTLQLSDSNEYDGGDLEFMYSSKTKKVPREKGFCVLFPSYITHRVSPVTRGIRKSLVLWSGGVPFK